MNRKANLKKKFVPSFQSQIFAAFLIVLVLEGLYITEQLITLFLPIRYVIFLFLLTGLFLYVVSIIKVGSLRKNQVYSVVFHLFLLSYGLFFKSGKRWVFFALASRSFIFFFGDILNSCCNVRI